MESLMARQLDNPTLFYNIEKNENKIGMCCLSMYFTVSSVNLKENKRNL